MCGEQHYLRTSQHAFVAYLHGGYVINSTMFDVVSDPYEQRNLLVSGAPEAAPLQAWSELAASELETWPRHEVEERDASRKGVETCGEYRR